MGIDFKTFYPLMLYFMAGVGFYQFKEIVRFNLAGALLATFLIFFLHEFVWAFYLKLVLLPYIIFTMAFSNSISFNNIGKYGDFSYGMYLYAFPVQQLIAYFLADKFPFGVLVVFSFLFTIPFAFFSWFMVEKPALKLKRKLNGRFRY